MGAALSWLASRTNDSIAIWDALGVDATDDPDASLSGRLAGVVLSSGWSLVVARGYNHRLIAPQRVSEISRRWPVVACSVEEHVMVCSAEYWKAGQRVWRVSHDAQQGRFDLECTGEAPDGFGALRDEIFAEQQGEGGEQADVDLVFEIPMLLAQRLTTFKHDEEWPQWEAPGPVALCPRPGSSLAPRRWWQFGRR